MDITRVKREGGTVAARVFGIAVGIASSAITARALGPEQRGGYFYALSLANLLATAGNFGASSANGFFAAKQPDVARRLAGWSMLVAGMIGGGCAGLFILASRLPPFQRFATPEGHWLLLLAPAILATSLLGPLLAGLHQFRALNLLQVAQQVATVAAFAWVAWRIPTPGAFLAALAIVAACGAVVQALWSARSSAPASSKLAITAWVRYGLKAYVVLMLGSVLSRLGVLFLRAHANSVELGQYSVALQIWDGLSLIPSSLAAVLFPMIVRGNTLSWKHCRSEIWRMSAAVIAILLVTALVLRPAILLIFGAPFSPAYVVTLCLLPGFLPYACVVVTSQYLAAKGFPRAVATNWIIALGLLIVGCTAFVPRFGAVGAAAVTSGTYTTLALLMLLTAKKQLQPAAAS